MLDYMDDGPSKVRSSGGQSQTPVLDNFSRDLIKLAEEGKLDPVIGRDDEIKRIAQILSRRKKNNPIIIGDPGCGKTAIVEGLAIKIQKGECPRNLADKRIVTLDITSLVAGTKYRGQFEERMKIIMDELRDDPNTIIFIDEIHTIVGAGNASGSLDASNIFKPALARGELQCIGATTLDEYKKHIEKDGALERRFQKIIVDGTTKEQTLTILKNIRQYYEDYHKVSYSDEILEKCVELADRYITDREFPDKAIDILDEVGSRCKVDIKSPTIIDELKKEAQKIKDEKINVVREQRYEEAANLRDKEKKILIKLKTENEKFEDSLTKEKKKVTLDVLYDVISGISKIPVQKLSSNETKRLKHLSDKLKENVIGQDIAIDKISRSIRRHRLGINNPNKPIGSYIFLGSTGVGKTLMAKKIAEEVFGSSDALIRVDMSEYQEKHSISKLIGSPPGYIGYDDGGQLTDKVKNNPYSVILFDEIEKANSDVFSTLLQVLDDGHMTDGLGRKVNFKNTIIIMTSNLGIKKLQEFGKGIGFDTNNGSFVDADIRERELKKELKKFFAPEFLNRIDDIIVFNNLNQNDISKIVEIELKILSDRMDSLGYKISFDESIINHISEVGFDDVYGARPLKRAIQSEVEDYISDMIIDNKIKKSKSYQVKYDSESKSCTI